MRGRGPGEQRGDGTIDRRPRPGGRDQGVHGERGGVRRDRRAGRQGGTRFGPGGRAHQQRGRHHRTRVPGRKGSHNRIDHQHQPVGTFLGESVFTRSSFRRERGEKTTNKPFRFHGYISIVRISRGVIDTVII